MSGSPNVSPHAGRAAPPPREKRAGRFLESLDRAPIVDANFLRALDAWPQPTTLSVADLDRALGDDTSLTGAALLELFESQMITRHLDLAARELRAQGRGFYTIASAGHEGNALLGRLTRATDPAFLHYRSGAFMAERARNEVAGDPVRDVLLSLLACRDDPASGGRHKVWGSRMLWVLPQTSTIASHLPKAVGTALALARTRRLGVAPPVPPDSIVVCSFGDASVNHSTASGAFNTAQWTALQRLPLPLLFVCEDNGLGISVPTPAGWIEKAFSRREGLLWYQANGCDLRSAWETCREAVARCRADRVPVFLHLKMNRLMGHAGSDVEIEYRSREEIEAAEERDPLVISATSLMAAGVAGPDQIRARYEAIRERVRCAAARVLELPGLESAAEIMAPLAPYQHDAVAREAVRDDYQERRRMAFGERLPELGPPRHLAVQINRGLHDILAKYPEAVIFGEDVARKGGVYHVTPGLQKAFGKARVFDTLLDEQAILGMAQGAAYMGLLPIPEIQYLAYLHNAADQIRGEACSTQFFSNGAFRNPMVVRIASLAYQKGFGGHFHNDNSIAALRDIPGLVVACPGRGDDAAGMLRTCAALARVDGRVVAFLEPIALYMTKDLHAAGDGQWSFPYPPPSEAVPFLEPRVYGPEARDLLIITFGNGTWMSLRAARRFEGAQVRVLDLRWLAPLNHEAIARHARDCKAVLVVDEGRGNGGIGEAIVTGLVEHVDPLPPIRRLAGRDTYIPIGPAADLVLVSEAQILSAARALVEGRA